MKKFHSTKLGERIIWAVIAITCLLVTWYLVTFRSTSGVFPDPVSIAKRLLKSFSEPIGTMTIQRHIVFSLTRVCVGVVIGCSCGIILGLLMGINEDIQAFVSPVFYMIRPIPTVAWIPLSIMWFGLGETTKYFLIFISSFTGCTIQAYSGVKSIDNTLVGAAKMLGANNFRIFRTIILPSCVPNISLGIQAALASGWATVVAAEMVRSSEGVGWLIVAGQNNMDTQQIMVGIVVIGIVGACIGAVAMMIENRLSRWNNRSGL